MGRKEKEREGKVRREKSEGNGPKGMVRKERKEKERKGPKGKERSETIGKVRKERKGMGCQSYYNYTHP